MDSSTIEIAIYYCQHQGNRIPQVLKALQESGPWRARKVALPCTGKLEVMHLTKALESGAEGVAVFGCHLPECSYVVGSERAEGRVRYAQRILEEIGLEEDRIHRFVLDRPTRPGNVEGFFEWVEKIRSLRSFHANPGKKD